MCKITKKNLAAQIAGFSSAELISQSTAVATAYRHKFVEQVRTEAPQTVGTLSVGAQTTEVKQILPLKFNLKKNIGIGLDQFEILYVQSNKMYSVKIKVK